MRFDKWFLAGVIVFGLSVTSGADEVKRVQHEGTVEVLSEIGRVVEVVVSAGVASLVRTGLPSSIKVEQVSGHLFITPLARNAAELVVIDAAGRSYRLKFVFDNGCDEKVLILPKEEDSNINHETVASMELMRDLASGHAPAGAVEILQDKIIFVDERVRIKIVLMYEMPEVVGYVLSAENLLTQALVVPVEQFTFPGLLAVASQKDILSPAGEKGSKGVMYMVASR